VIPLLWAGTCGDGAVQGGVRGLTIPMMSWNVTKGNPLRTPMTMKRKRELGKSERTMNSEGRIHAEGEEKDWRERQHEQGRFDDS
jgi:hypothetical protein